VPIVSWARLEIHWFDLWVDISQEEDNMSKKDKDEVGIVEHSSKANIVMMRL